MFNINSKGLLTCLIVWISLHSLIRRKEKKKEDEGRISNWKSNYWIGNE